MKAMNNSALFAAIETGDMREVDFQLLLIDRSAMNQLNEDGFTPLMAAIEANNETMIERLFLFGADLNAVDSKGQSVLARAIRHARKPGNEDFTFKLRLLGAR